ncbi:alpha/beta fold hydrolase [Kitasatospora sp. P5_F3]
MTRPGMQLLRPGLLPGARKVLLLHGMGAGDNIWHLYRALAGPELELWTVKLPWRFNGERSWAHEPGCARLVADLLDTRFDAVVAHSFAANLLLEALVQEGGRPPTATVLLSPFYRPTPDAFRWETASYYLGEFHRFLESGIAARRLMHGCSPLDADVLHGMGRHVRDQIGPYGWLRFFETYLRTPWLRLDRLRGPCLVVAGQDDRAASPCDGSALAAALPAGRLVVLQETGHFAMVEAAAAFSAALDAFFSETLRTRPVHPAPPVARSGSGVRFTYPEEQPT